MNVLSLEIHCVKCNVEILDETFTNVSPQRLVPFKMGVRRMIHALITQKLGMETQEKGHINYPKKGRVFEVNKLELAGFDMSLPVLFYSIWSVPFFRFVTEASSDIQANLSAGARESEETLANDPLEVNRV
jgi:hypothetical protein